jgi:DNA-directed RNA polymerase subunit RPC12/RpoP
VPRPVPDQTRQGILADLREGKLSTREIQAKYKVSAGTVSDVKQKGGLPVAKRSRAPAEQAPSGAGQEADGLTEYNPPGDSSSGSSKPQQEAKPARQSCSSCKAQWELEQGEHPLARCPRCQQHPGATEPADEIYGCGHCGARWQLDKADAALPSCPKCGVTFVA